MNEHTPTADNNKRRHLQSMIFFSCTVLSGGRFFPLSRPNYYNSFLLHLLHYFVFVYLGMQFVCIY